MQKTFYRPVWTCGRYDIASKSAIMYNLVAGFSFFFEDKSAEVIGSILKCRRGKSFTLRRIVSETNVPENDIVEFLRQLCNYGLVSLTETTQQIIDEYRARFVKIGICKQSVNKEFGGLTVPVSDAEKAYVVRVNKKASVVMIELTYNCSEQCIHCYNPGATRNDDEENHRGKGRKMSLDQYKQIIDELDAQGTFLVCLTGGDPFSNRFAWDIIDYLYEKEIAFEIFTNGQSLAGKELRLANYFPCYVAISIYSALEEVHDSITRVKGSLSRSKSVLEKLHSLHVPLILKCVIMQNNVKSYRSVATLGKQFNAEVQFDCRLFDSLGGDKCVSKYLRLTPEQLMIAFRDKNSLYYVGLEAKDCGALKHRPNEPACLMGFNNLCITPEGYVIPCCSFHAVLGDATKQSLNEIINGNRALDYLTTLNLSEYEECGRHEYCDFCILCPGLNFSENGNPKIAAENNCYYAKIRYQLYCDLKNGNDPLKGRNVEAALDALPDPQPVRIKRIKSESHFNETINLQD